MMLARRFLAALTLIAALPAVAREPPDLTSQDLDFAIMPGAA